jgi:phosphate transport system permease protein
VVGYLFLTIVALSLVAFFVGQRAGRRFATVHGPRRPFAAGYHGAFVAIWVGVPALILCCSGSCSRNRDRRPPGLAACPKPSPRASAGPAQLILSEIRNVAEPAASSRAARRHHRRRRPLVRWRGIARMGHGGRGRRGDAARALFARTRLGPRFRARHGVERLMTAS